MANPSYYNQTEAVQRTVNQLIREEYMTEVPELIFKVGSPTMRLLQPGTEIANAENQGINQRVITARANSGRATRTLLADFQRGRTSSAATLKLRYNYNDASANDFVSIEAATSVPWHDFTTSGNDIAAQVLDRAQQDVMDSLDYTTNVLMHSDQTGELGAINGTRRLSLTPRAPTLVLPGTRLVPPLRRSLWTATPSASSAKACTLTSTTPAAHCSLTRCGSTA